LVPYGDVLPAEGHLFDLLERRELFRPGSDGRRYFLRPEGLYGTRPAEGGNKHQAQAIRRRTHCNEFGSQPIVTAGSADRSGILEHYGYRGQVMRVLFTRRMRNHREHSARKT